MKKLPFLSIAFSVIILSTFMLYLLIWDYGVSVSWKDQRRYLNAALNFYQGNGLFMAEYSIDTDQGVSAPLTYFPPLTSMSYALLMSLEIPFNDIPFVIALLTWLLFLTGLGWLTYRLCGSRIITIFSIIVATITWPYLIIYKNAGSEALFLPLLIFLTLILIDLPQRKHQATFWLIIGVILLGLLMLSRYVGAFFYVATVFWWSWWRVKQKQTRKLIGELFVFSLAIIPLAAWVIRNLVVAGHPFGPNHLSSRPDYTFADTLKGLVQHSSWIVLPAVRPGPVWRSFGWPGVLICFIILAVGVYLLWRYRPKREQISIPPHTPIPIFLATYLALFIFIQPLIFINPMDARYMAVALCLLHPWLLSMLVRVPARWSYSFLTAFIALNVSLLILLSSKDAPNWISLNPPRYHDFADRPAEVWQLLNSGVPTWLLHRPPRLKDLPNHHPDITEYLQGLDSDISIISNAPDLFVDRRLTVANKPVSYWLDKGACAPRSDVVIIVIDWDRWAKGFVVDTWEPTEKLPAQLEAEIEQKCPQLSKILFKRGAAYHLTPSGVSKTEQADAVPSEGHRANQQ